MGPVGLNFGAANSGKGIDVENTVTQILANYQQVETPWKNQLADLQSQDAVLSTLGTQISTLTTDIQNLTDAIGVFSAKKGSSSDTNLLELTSASSLAVAGTHAITVSNLAQTSSAASGVVKADATLSGSVTIQVGTGQSYKVNVGDSSTAATISGLAAAINAAGIGVKATVLTDPTGTRLSVVSSTGGTAGTLSVSGTLVDTSTPGAPLPVSFAQIQPGIDANLQIDGITIKSASNTVTNALPGVTFQLLSANPDESVQVIITNDTSSVQSAISKLVDDYNTIIKSLNGQEQNDSTGKAEPLYGNSIVARLQNALQNTLISAPASGAIKSMYNVGITTNPDGTLALNTDTLTSTLNGNFDDMMGFFQNLGSFGTSFASTLNNLGTAYSSGLLALSLKMNSKQEQALNDNIENQETRLADMRTRLTAEFNKVNETLQGIPSQLNYVNQLYAAITGYNQK